MDRDEVPDMSETELFEYIRDELGVPVHRRAIKHAVINREIVPTQFSGRNLFSRNDGIEWVRSRKGADRMNGCGGDRRSAAARLQESVGV
jgi:hypothetical protein